MLEDIVGDPLLSPALGCPLQAVAPCWLLGTVWRRSCLRSGCKQPLISVPVYSQIENGPLAHMSISCYLKRYTLIQCFKIDMQDDFVQETKTEPFPTTDHSTHVRHRCQISKNRRTHRADQFSAGSQHGAEELVQAGGSCCLSPTFRIAPVISIDSMGCRH